MISLDWFFIEVFIQTQNTKRIFIFYNYNNYAQFDADYE